MICFEIMSFSTIIIMCWFLLAFTKLKLSCCPVSCVCQCVAGGKFVVKPHMLRNNFDINYRPRDICCIYCDFSWILWKFAVAVSISGLHLAYMCNLYCVLILCYQLNTYILYIYTRAQLCVCINRAWLLKENSNITTNTPSIVFVC